MTRQWNSLHYYKYNIQLPLLYCTTHTQNNKVFFEESFDHFFPIKQLCTIYYRRIFNGRLKQQYPFSLLMTFGANSKQACTRKSYPSPQSWISQLLNQLLYEQNTTIHGINVCAQY